MQTQITKIPVERRFPLSLTQSIGSIRELYDIGKQRRWNPEADIMWQKFDPNLHGSDARNAARLVWSRRAWIEYVGLYETPALLIRLCLETERESDLKYFLTVRNTEEGWQIESYHRYAKLLGGYIDRPSEVHQEAIFNQDRHRQVLDVDNDTDVFFTVHSAVEDTLELALFRAYLDNAQEPVAQQILQKSVEAKERHVAFGWLYVAERAANWSVSERAAVADGVYRYLLDIEMKGYHCPWMAAQSSAEARAADIAAKAGLGAATQTQEQAVFRSCIEDIRGRLEELGVALPVLTHKIFGTF